MMAQYIDDETRPLSSHRVRVCADAPRDNCSDSHEVANSGGFDPATPGVVVEPRLHKNESGYDDACYERQGFQAHARVGVNLALSAKGAVVGGHRPLLEIGLLEIRLVFGGEALISAEAAKRYKYHWETGATCSKGMQSETIGFGYTSFISFTSA